MPANSELSDHDARKLWTPSPRPEWVTRINEEGECMDIQGTVPLDPESLIHAAVKSTGLDDFGDDDWREPFAVLCKSFDEEADLNLLGRIRVRHELLLLLKARLQIEDTYKAHPEIEQEEILAPLMVIGQGRTGTSFLLYLLSAVPDNGKIMAWEAVFPCPPPEKESYDSDPRIEKAHRIRDQWNRVTPEIRSMQDFSGYVPQEDVVPLAYSFRNVGWFFVMGQVNSYVQYMATADLEPAYRYHKRVLKLLQWRNPRKRWALKNSACMDELTTILNVYPDVCFVWPHRDPTKALASGVSIIGTMLWASSEHPFKGAFMDAYTDAEGAAQKLTDVIDLMESGVIPKERVCNVQYLDLIAEPVGTVEKIYEFFELPFSATDRLALETYMSENPRTNRPPHRVSDETRAAVDRERAVFKRYIEYFGIPAEG